MKTKPHGHRLRLYRNLTQPGTFHVIKCVQPAVGVLRVRERDLIVSSLRYSVIRGRIELGAFVVMLDHFHLLFGLLGSWTVDRFMHAHMSFVGAKTSKAIGRLGCRWQRGYYEKEIRNRKDFNTVSDYIHGNPVEAGLVAVPEAWKHSSVHGFDWVTLSWW